MIDTRTLSRVQDLEERLAKRTAERDKAEAQERYWREAYFEHMQEHHPEIVERAIRRMAEDRS